MNASARILMCPPEFYGIEYVINPWMNTERQADQPTAASQWNDLRRILGEHGATIELLTPVAGLPDLVFTANAALIYRCRAILSRFRHQQRQGEEEYDAAWLSENGFRVEVLPEDHFFEGAGDALFCGDTLFAGYRMRSQVSSHQLVAARINRRVLPVELVDPYYYHLDTCFCPLSAEVAAYFPGAFDDYGRQVFREHIPTLIEVDKDEARAFACNAVVIGSTVTTNTGCPFFHEQLRALGFTPVATPLGEFVKAGGSAKCLTLRLDGEDAAMWAHGDR
ncbi:MAG: amidinotransferase [Planctomycetaceae bacterium]|nr:amidinotransferase [Planctomycetales bacterium]MCB9927303.1 amidinotransferase [Planctomycetaceae bacterium]